LGRKYKVAASKSRIADEKSRIQKEGTVLKNFSMRGSQKMMIITALCFLASTLAAFGHHSLFAEFDRIRQTQFRATVTSFEWANPHASFQASVQREGSTATVWTFELPGPSGLVKFGWTPETLHTNDTISITAFPAKDGSARASVYRVVLGNGQTIELDHPFAYQPDRNS
jgi:hypothetical protein